MPLNINFQQIFLHMMNFLILFGILYFLLYKPVKNFMDKRTAYFENLKKETEENLEAAKQEKALYEEKLQNVKEEIRRMNEEAIEEAEETSDELIHKAEESAEALIAEAREAMKHEHEQMLEETDEEITELVSDAAEKLMFKDTSEAFDAFLTSMEGEK